VDPQAIVNHLPILVEPNAVTVNGDSSIIVAQLLERPEALLDRPPALYPDSRSHGVDRHVKRTGVNWDSWSTRLPVKVIGASLLPRLTAVVLPVIDLAVSGFIPEELNRQWTALIR